MLLNYYAIENKALGYLKILGPLSTHIVRCYSFFLLNIFIEKLTQSTDHKFQQRIHCTSQR